MLEVKWKGSAVVSVDVGGEGFNPCYVGSKMERLRTYGYGNSNNEFQSLLCWK